MDDISVDDMPVDDLPVHDLSVDDLSVDDLSVDDLSVDGLSVDDRRSLGVPRPAAISILLSFLAFLMHEERTPGVLCSMCSVCSACSVRSPFTPCDNHVWDVCIPFTGDHSK